MSAQKINLITLTVDRWPNQDLNLRPSAVQASTVQLKTRQDKMIVAALAIELQYVNALMDKPSTGHNSRQSDALKNQLPTVIIIRMMTD